MQTQTFRIFAPQSVKCRPGRPPSLAPFPPPPQDCITGTVLELEISPSLCPTADKDNGSHFMTYDPRDPSVNWPVTRMTHDSPLLDHSHCHSVTFEYLRVREGSIDGAISTAYVTVPTPSP